MTEHRFYLLDFEGHVIGAPHVATCEDNKAAMVHAQQLAGLYAIEVWRDAKRIGLIPNPRSPHKTTSSGVPKPSAGWSRSG
jgi:hypothetical protein